MGNDGDGDGGVWGNDGIESVLVLVLVSVVLVL